MPTVLVERLLQTWIKSKLLFCYEASIVQTVAKKILFFPPPSDKLMWLHTAVAFLYLLLTVHTMRQHTSRMHYKKDDLVGEGAGLFKCTRTVR